MTSAFRLPVLDTFGVPGRLARQELQVDPRGPKIVPSMPLTSPNGWEPVSDMTTAGIESTISSCCLSCDNMGDLLDNDRFGTA